MLKRFTALLTALLLLLSGSLFAVGFADTLTAETEFFDSTIQNDVPNAADETAETEPAAEETESEPVDEKAETEESEAEEQPAIKQEKEGSPELQEEELPAEMEKTGLVDYVRLSKGVKLYTQSGLSDCYGTLKSDAVVIRISQRRGSVHIALNDGKQVRVLWVSASSIGELSETERIEYAEMNGRLFHGDVLTSCSIALEEEPAVEAEPVADEAEPASEEAESEPMAETETELEAENQSEEADVSVENTEITEIPEAEQEAKEESPEPSAEPAEEAVEPTEEPAEEAVEPIEEPAEEAVEPIEEPAEEAVEPTEEPAEEAVEPSEESEEENVEEPVDEPADEAEVNSEAEQQETAPENDAKPMEVRIHSNVRDVMVNGETCTLTAELIGFEYCKTIRLQWFVDKGNGWEEIPGANDLTYVFIADENTLSYRWCVSVDFE